MKESTHMQTIFMYEKRCAMAKTETYTKVKEDITHTCQSSCRTSKYYVRVFLFFTGRTGFNV